MELSEERFLALQALAEKQAKQIEEGNAFANKAAAQLQESQRQLEVSQQNLTDLTNAFNSLTSQSRPLTVSSAPKKKPELPPFDSKHVLIWIRRVEAAYSRAGVVQPKDKFAWMESIFQVKLDPQIDAYLYGNNTEQDWENFIAYLKLQYGPTTRQKAQKLMVEVPRHDLRPSQYLIQLVEDTKDVKVDDIRKEHLLNTIPPRIREIMGKEVEQMTAAEVAQMADSFFDRKGRPIEKAAMTVNHIAAKPTTSTTLPPSTSAYSATSTTSSTLPPSTSSSFAFTHAYSDEDANVNHIRKNGKINDSSSSSSRSRSGSQRSRSRFNFSKTPNSSSTGTRQGDADSTKQAGLCRWHRRFGDKSYKCSTDCSLHKSFISSQKPGNGKGGRRL